MSINLAYDLVVVGGGAAGIFGAIQAAEAHPKLKILVLEKSQNLLSKVKISGGGRCNVTHACFEPSELVNFYPRGQKELRGPFHQFMCGDMISWLEEHGVTTKIEADGRIFPTTNSSQTIIDCFLDLCSQYGIQIQKQEAVLDLIPSSTKWTIVTKINNYLASNILFTTGSSPQSWKLIERIGHTNVTPVPSLFTFNIKDPLILDLQGISFPEVVLKTTQAQLSSLGPLLITHWGLSGPAILKMSAWGARQLSQSEYKFTLTINWVNESMETIVHKLRQQKEDSPGQLISKTNVFNLSKRFYLRLLQLCHLGQSKWGPLSNQELNNLAESLGNYPLQVTGKSTYKDEFVTSGGVELKEINFKTMESKVVPGLYFAGEVLDIDAITGGFNFQAAWTTAYIAGKSIAQDCVL